MGGRPPIGIGTSPPPTPDSFCLLLALRFQSRPLGRASEGAREGGRKVKEDSDPFSGSNDVIRATTVGFG